MSKQTEDFQIGKLENGEVSKQQQTTTTTTARNRKL